MSFINRALKLQQLNSVRCKSVKLRFSIFLDNFLELVNIIIPSYSNLKNRSTNIKPKADRVSRNRNCRHFVRSYLYDNRQTGKRFFSVIWKFGIYMKSIVTQIDLTHQLIKLRI